MSVQPPTLIWNGEEKRPRAGLRITAFVLIQSFLLLAVSASVGALLLSFTDSGASPSILSPATEAVDVRLISAVTTFVAALASVWIAGRLLDRRPFIDYGFALNSDWLRGWLFGLFAGGVVITGVFLLQWGLGWVQITGTFWSSGASAFALIGPILFFALAAFAEDLIYWGYLLTNLSEGLASSTFGRSLPVVLALVAVSSFFALGHALNPDATVLSTLNIAVAGVMLALGYVLTGQLAITLGVHFSWNLFQGYVFGFPVSGLDPTGATLVSIQQRGPDLWNGGPFGPEAGIFGLLAMLMVCAIVLLRAWLRGEASISHAIADYRGSKHNSIHAE